MKRGRGRASGIGREREHVCGVISDGLGHGLRYVNYGKLLFASMNRWHCEIGLREVGAVESGVGEITLKVTMIRSNLSPCIVWLANSCRIRNK